MSPAWQNPLSWVGRRVSEVPEMVDELLKRWCRFVRRITHPRGLSVTSGIRRLIHGRQPAGQRGRLLNPRRHLRLIEVVLVDVDPARVFARAATWNGSQRRALEEG